MQQNSKERVTGSFLKAVDEMGTTVRKNICYKRVNKEAEEVDRKNASAIQETRVASVVMDIPFP